MIAILRSRYKLALLLLLCSIAGAVTDPAKELKFIADDSVCGGHFAKEPESKYQEELDFSADSSTINAKTGVSQLQGNTHVVYKNDNLFADNISLQQDKSVAAVNAKFSHNDDVILAQSALWDIKNNASLQDASFKVPMPTARLKSAWGNANSVKYSGDKIELLGSSYSICSPKSTTWQLDAGSLTLDKASHQGYATNVLFRLYKVPVFYLPVLYFPLGKERSSGFLYPKLSYSNTGKMTVKVPFYFNLSANYDALVTASYYGSRGFAWQSYTRFLTAKSSGSLYLGGWLRDREFSTFKTDFASTFAASDAGTEELLNNLAGASNSRQFLFYNASYQPFKSLKLNMKYAWLSDDYMRQDFDDVGELLPERRIPRAVNAIFDNSSFLVNFNWSQDRILQPLGKTILKGLFSAEPDLYVKHSIYSNSGFSFKQSLQVLGFEPATRIDLDDDFDISGWRALYKPQLGYTLNRSFYSLNVMLGANILDYDWNYYGCWLFCRYEKKMAIPWLSVDNKWYFTNNKQLLITPRLLFKYVPYKDQSALPILDAGYSAPDYTRFFSINRFLGSDRFGDASSFVFGVENKIFTSMGPIDVNIGKSYDLRLHKVCLDSGCLLDEQASGHWSDWVVASSIKNSSYTFDLDLALAHKLQSADKLYLSLDYKNSAKLYYHYAKIINAYDSSLVKNKIMGYTHEQDLSRNWSAFGNLEYDTSDDNFVNYIMGLKYKSCCLDMKLGLKRNYSGVNGYGKSQYKNSVVLDFALPGFGS